MNVGSVFLRAWLLLPFLCAVAVGDTFPHVAVELVTETTSVRIGQAFRAGIHFQPEPGWHVYWKNPGDSGEPVKIAWQLPAGFAPEPIEWPRPHRIPVGPLVNFGYEGDVLFASRIQPSPTLPDRAAVIVAANVSWLVCHDTCVPGKARLTASLPASNEPASPSPAAALFARAREQVPQPMPDTWKPSAKVTGDRVVFTLGGAPPSLRGGSDFFAATPNVVESASRPVIEARYGVVTLSLKASDGIPRPPPDKIEATIAVGESGYDVTFPVEGGVAPAAAAPAASPAPAPAVKPGLGTIVEMLLLAFLGGLVLNLMPCVFPVLSIKAVGLLKAHADRHAARVEGLLYTAGVLASFWLLAGLLIFLRANGEKLGWGFQLQAPGFLFSLAALLFLMSLSLLGVFHFGESLMGVGSGLASRGGHVGAFMSGVLATVVATPCTAPFMGTAIGFAATQPAIVALLVFTSLALGLALPYAALAMAPVLGRFLPRPGRWMETLKQGMAFPLLGTVVWLVWVLDLQAGPGAAAATLAVFLCTALGAWMWARWPYGALRWIGASLVAAAFVWGFQNVRHARRASPGPRLSTGDWAPWSKARVAELVREGKPVFVDFTAAWCVTCHVNEAAAFTEATMEAFHKRGVVTLRADWTNADPEISQALREFDRDGVPLYVLYSGRAGEPPRLLPQVITAGLVISELDKIK